jgi:hypothetical protein
VQQGGGVDELHGRGQLVMAAAFITQQAGTAEGEHRPQPLAAAGDQMAGQLRDQRHLRLHPIKDDMIHSVQPRRGQVHQRLDRRFAAKGMDCRGHGRFLTASNGLCKHGLAPRAAVPQKSCAASGA